jgi:uncharacterized integral membrane protein
MPWRLIEFIVIFIVFLFFIVFNLENKCDIGFGFSKIPDVPVFLTALFSFLFGMLCALPFIIKARAIKKGKTGAAGKEPQKRQGKKSAPPPQAEDSSFSDGGPYGVN